MPQIHSAPLSDQDSLAVSRSLLGDRYAIEREIGRGGMASVFAARDLRHGRQVAVKVLHPHLATALGPERFQAPSFIGLSRSQAEARAAEFGLEASFTDLPGGTGVVITQSPAPGVMVSYGDTIQLFLL